MESLDRISREKVGTAMEWLLGLIRVGARIGTTVDDRIYDENSINDPLQLMGSLMIMSRANEENELKARRVRESWDTRRKKGIKGAVCPSWLYLDTDGQYKPYPDRVEVVKEIFNWAIDGIGTFTIARMLNERAVTDPRYKPFDKLVGKKGKGWNPTTVYLILTSRALLGYHQHGMVADDGQTKLKVGEEIEGYFPKAIDESLWLRAQSARKKATPVKKGVMLTNLFGTKAQCAQCQSVMRIVTKAVAKGRPDYGKVFRYFTCSNAHAKRGCTAKDLWNYDELEAAILDHVPEYKLADVFARNDDAKELDRVENDLAALAFRVAELEKREARMVTEISKTEPDDPLLPAYRKNAREVASEVRKTKETMQGLTELRAELVAQQAHQGDLDTAVLKLRKEIDEATDSEKFKLRSRLSSALQSFIDFISFDSRDEVFDVVIMGGMIAHRFRKGQPQGRGGARKIEYVGSANVAQVLGDLTVRQAFTVAVGDASYPEPTPIPEDQERVETFDRLFSTK